MSAARVPVIGTIPCSGSLRMAAARLRSAVGALTAAIASVLCVQCAPRIEPAVFGDQHVVEIRLEAPLSRLFRHGQWDKYFHVDGRLSYVDGAGRTITLSPVRLEVRGNSSRESKECSFPKLKLTLPRDASAGQSIFRDTRTIDLGTHCGDRRGGDLTPIGRVANQVSPLREAWVYRLLGALAVPTLRARPARITYVNTEHAVDPSQWKTLVRTAVLVEDDGAAAARLGAQQVRRFTTATEAFDRRDTIRLLFAQAMIGNFDWCLRFERDGRYQCSAKQPLYNLLQLQRADGSAFPVMYDFDLAGVVTGSHPWLSTVYSEQFASDRSRRFVEVFGQLERTRSLFDRGELDAVRAEFAAGQTVAYQTLADSRIDPEGESIARDYLDAFFALMRDDAAFYSPVVASDGTKAWTDPTHRNAACPEDDEVPVGTPIGAALEQQGALIKVALLDVTWKWYDRCPATREPVWIPAAAVSRTLPSRAQHDR